MPVSCEVGIIRCEVKTIGKEDMGRQVTYERRRDRNVEPLLFDYIVQAIMWPLYYKT